MERPVRNGIEGGIVRRPPAEEMQAFDALPASVQEKLRTAPFEVSAFAASIAILRFGVADTLQRIDAAIQSELHRAIGANHGEEETGPQSR